MASDSGAQVDPARMTALTTEHFTLQTARSAMVSDASARTGSFLTAVSASLVALGFIAQAAHLGAAFDAFALTILPTLVFLGLVTVDRTVQIGVEDQMYALAIARIREAYVSVAGVDRNMLLLAARPDFATRTDGLLGEIGARQGTFLQVLVATPGLNSVVTAVLIGSTVALVVSVSGGALALAVAIGAVVGLAALAGLLRYVIATFQRGSDGATRYIHQQV